MLEKEIDFAHACSRWLTATNNPSHAYTDDLPTDDMPADYLPANYLLRLVWSTSYVCRCRARSTPTTRANVLLHCVFPQDKTSSWCAQEKGHKPAMPATPSPRKFFDLKLHIYLSSQLSIAIPETQGQVTGYRKHAGHHPDSCRMRAHGWQQARDHPAPRHPHGTCCYVIAVMFPGLEPVVRGVWAAATPRRSPRVKACFCRMQATLTDAAHFVCMCLCLRCACSMTDDHVNVCGPDLFLTGSRDLRC